MRPTTSVYFKTKCTYLIKALVGTEENLFLTELEGHDNILTYTDINTTIIVEITEMEW